MVIYEVNLTINKEIASKYKLWLNDHVKEMLTFPGFIGATLLNEELNDSSAHEKITVQYQLESRDDLEKYFTEQAPRMREDGIKRFGDKFSATRRIFSISQTTLH